MMKKKLLASLLLCMAAAMNAQWDNLNPGHGGRVQGLTCYDKQPGRMFVCSDMEGFYATDDYGEHWEYLGKNAPTSLAIIAQQSGNRIFYGSFDGLAYTDDEGDTWVEPDLLKDEPIGVITVDSDDEERIYVGNQWLVQFTRKLTIVEDGSQVIYRTTDRGNTWEAISYASGTGYRRVNSITLNPINHSEILVASGTGLYRSTNNGNSWSKIAAPEGTDGPNNTIGECTGADLTKDGQWLYAIYNKKGSTRSPKNDIKESHLYVKQFPNGAWQDLGPAGNDNLLVYWQPRVWQGAAPDNKHYVLSSQFTQGRNDGLYEGTFTVDGNQVSGSIESIFNFNKLGRGITTDAGWNQFVVNQSRNKTYWPASWSGTWSPSEGGTLSYERGVLTMSQQSFFVGDAADPDSWNVQSCSVVNTLPNGANTYRTNGTQSTFTYDVAQYKNYLVMGQADNGILESFDYGFSWTQLNTPSQQDAHSFLVIPGNPTMLLASVAFGYGGGNPGGNAQLIFKYITDTTNQTDEWKTITTGKEGEPSRKGSPPVRAWIIKSDPNNPYRVYCGTQKGVFVTEDIRTLVDANENNDLNFREIWGDANEPNQSLPVNDIAFDPLNSNVLYVKAQKGNLKGTRNPNGSFTWEIGIDSNGKSNYFNAQGNTEGGVESVAIDGNVYTYTTRNNPEMGNNLRRFDLYMSENGSTLYKPVLDWEVALSILGEPDWFDPQIHDFMIGDFSVKGNKIYIPYHVWQLTRKGFGCLEATINGDGSLSNIKNFGDDGSQRELEYSVAQRTRIFTDDQNVTRFFMATSGGGLTAKEIPTGVTVSNKPPTVTLLNTDQYTGLIPNSDVLLEVAASDSDGTVNKVEFFVGSTKIGQDTSSPYEFNWQNVPRGKYAIVAKATDNSGNTRTTGALLAVGEADGTVAVSCDEQSSGGKPNPPCNLIATQLSQNAFKLQWQDNSDNETYFDIQYRKDGDSWKGGGVSDAPANAQQIDILDFDVSGTQTVTFRVKSHNENGGSLWTLSDPLILDGNLSVPLQGISFDTQDLELAQGSSTVLALSFEPVTASDKSVVFSSSNPAVATVDETGSVNGISIGTATISVVSNDGGFSDSITVTVVDSDGVPEPHPNGNGDCSATSPGGKPNPPCNFQVEVVSDTSVLLRWTDNSDNENYFDIQSKKGEGPFRGGNMPNAPQEASDIIVDGLESGAVYSFRIKAFGDNGGSVWVESDSVTLIPQQASLKTLITDEISVVSIYPVPSEARFTVNTPESSKALMIDFTGRVIKELSLNIGENTVDLTGYAKGTYFLYVQAMDSTHQLILK